MITVLFIVQIILAVALVISVLIQRSDQDGFGLGSGGGTGLISGRSKANLLTRTTAILATLFMLNSILLTVLSTGSESSSLINQIEQMSNPEATPKEEAPAAPVVPRDGETSTMTPAPAEEAPTAETPAAEAPAVPAEEAPAETEPTEVPKPQ